MTDTLDLDRAHAFEDQVRDRLTAYGWRVELFGQRVWAEPFREWARLCLSDWPQLGDMLAVKHEPSSGRTRLWMVDAKSGDRYRDTGNHCMELLAYQAAARLHYHFGMGAAVVFSDWTAATVPMINRSGRRWVGPITRGTRDPFLIVPVSACRPFADLFGSPHTETAPGATR